LLKIAIFNIAKIHVLPGSCSFPTCCYARPKHEQT